MAEHVAEGVVFLVETRRWLHWDLGVLDDLDALLVGPRMKRSKRLGAFVMLACELWCYDSAEARDASEKGTVS